MNYKIKFKKLSPEARMPERKTLGAIAFDVYCPKQTIIKPGRNIVPLDFAIELPVGYEAKIEARSGFSAKGFEGLSSDGLSLLRYNADVKNGKIDPDYRGNVGVIVMNNDVQFVVPAGSRIAQMTIYHSPTEWHFEEVEELSDTDRADGGFGHTGTGGVNGKS